MNVCRVLAFAVAIAASVQCIGWSGVPTTNEVDAVFADTIFSTNRVESYNRFEAMRKKASELAMHLYTLKNSVSENDIKRHVIFKILAMPIPYEFLDCVRTHVIRINLIPKFRQHNIVVVACPLAEFKYTVLSIRDVGLH